MVSAHIWNLYLFGRTISGDMAFVEWRYFAYGTMTSKRHFDETSCFLTSDISPSTFRVLIWPTPGHLPSPITLISSILTSHHNLPQCHTSTSIVTCVLYDLHSRCLEKKWEQQFCIKLVNTREENTSCRLQFNFKTCECYLLSSSGQWRFKNWDLDTSLKGLRFGNW